jgi:hypothetical protein
MIKQDLNIVERHLQQRLNTDSTALNGQDQKLASYPGLEFGAFQT